MERISIRWGLRRKVLLSMVTVILLLGLAMAGAAHAILLKVLKTEFQHKGISSARSIAANSVVDLLTRNTGRLKKLAENEKALDSSIAYIFITDSSGRVLTHTFNKGFPLELSKANTIRKGKDYNVRTLDTQLGLIYDIAAPIYLEKGLLGQVRLGILQNSIQRAINTINFMFTGVVLLIMALGVFLVSKVSSLIVMPISRLVEAAQAIQKGDFSTRLEIRSRDEIGVLAEAFNEMAAHLNLMVEEVKGLTAAGERNRIAFDLHDGCAQNMANIIKRLELCEKLFKIDPHKAIEELSSLRDVTKGLLQQTRQVIFDLKSPEDADFNLPDRLKDYLKEYQEQSNINAGLSASAAAGAIPADKGKAVFYIIREALANIKKHAQAKNAQISLAFDGQGGLLIEIKDDGQGFNVFEAESSAFKRGRLGLVSMHQRADALGGKLSISSEPKQGAKVTLSIPLLKKQERGDYRI